MPKPKPLNPLASIALRRYRDDLTRLPFSPTTSEVVDCINRVLDYAEVQA